MELLEEIRQQYVHLWTIEVVLIDEKVGKPIKVVWTHVDAPVSKGQNSD